MALITYNTKVALNENQSIADENKVKADDMNEIKSVVNDNYTELSARGYIEESGSNANGSYIKYSDGTMICYKTLTGTIDISTAWGSLYTSAALDLGVWAANFISRPAIMINTQNQSGTQFMLGGAPNGSIGSASSVGSTTLIRPNSRTGAAYQLDVIGIGKWK